MTEQRRRQQMAPALQEKMRSLLQNTVRLLGSALPAALLGIVLVVVSAEVFARAVLQRPFQTAHELSVVAFAFVVWFGIVGNAAKGQMFGVRVFVDRMPPRARRVAEAIGHISVLLIAGAVLHSAVIQVQTSQFTRFLALGWPKWIVPAGLAIAMASVLAIHVVRLFALFRPNNHD